MENDLIKRSELLSVFKRWERVPDYNEAERHIIKAAIYEAETIPAVDAVEVKHGRWEGNYPQAMFRLKRCSVCETLAPEGWYCFFCGARMDGRREDGDA